MSKRISKMSEIVILENLVRFIEVNAQRREEHKSTICTTSNGVEDRKYLPCNNKNEKGEYIIACSDCPFSSTEAAKETIKILQEKIIKKQKLIAILRQDNE